MSVDLGGRGYPIEIGSGLLDAAGTYCAGAGLRGTALMVSDSHVRPLHAVRVEKSLSAAGFRVQTLDVPAGEPSKDWTQLGRLCEAARSAGLDRNGFVVALGGGVVGDLAGFLAAIWLRGVSFVQIPTTVLAMVDSSVGGKTGINLPAGKNLVGAFHQPRLVLADLDVLKTLPCREFSAGMAEVVKYGAIRDVGILDELRTRAPTGPDAFPAPAMESLIARCCQIKADIVGLDERETGLRAILNFGHTLGHALETCAGYGTLLHGEAVAMGMVYAAHLSAAVCGFDRAQIQPLANLLAALGLPVRVPSGLAWDEVRRAMSSDKKVSGGRVRFVLLTRNGWAEPGYEVREEVLKEGWRHVGGE